jgi:hypothetical protein
MMPAAAAATAPDGSLEGGGLEEAGLFGDLVGLVGGAVDEGGDEVSAVVGLAVHDHGCFVVVGTMASYCLP